MAGVAALVSAGVGLYGATQGSSTAGNVPMAQSWQVPQAYMIDAMQNAYGGIGNLPGQQVPGQLVPQYQQTGQNLYNNPYAQMFQQGSLGAAGMGQQGGQTAFNTGQMYQGAGASLVPYAQPILNTAFDPQSALHDRLAQQTVDTNRAAQAVRGVGTTPYGASLENDAMRKFEIDWQNAQLGRQTAGAQAAGGLYGDALRTSAGGAALSDTGTQNFLGASQMPFSAFNTIGQGQFGALNSVAGGVGGAQQIAMNPVQAYLSFLGLGDKTAQKANSIARTGLDQAGMSFNQNQQLGSQFGSSMAGLGNKNNWSWLSSLGSNDRSNPNNNWPAFG